MPTNPPTIPAWMRERPWRVSGNDALDALLWFRSFYGTHAECPGCHRVIPAADWSAHAGHAGTNTADPCAPLAALVAAYRATGVAA